MRKNLQYKILVAIMAASAVNWALPANVLAGYEQDGNYYVESNGEIVNSNYNLIYGDGNSFTIDGGTISGAVGAGDEDYNGVVSDGNITINDGTITSNVFGGMAENGIVHNNHVTINNGAIYNVYGGYSQKSAVHNNTVTINDGTVSYVYGAASDNVSVTENKVYIKGGSVNFIVGGFSPESNAGSNTVDISGSAVTTGEIYGGYSENGIADNNNVNISGNSQIISSIRGGYSENGTAEHNIVNISGGTIGSDEYSRNVYGGHSYDGNAIDNIVNISGGSVNGDVYGGYSENSSANNNIVNISVGSVEGVVYGGWSLSHWSLSNSDGSADNNVINISGGSVSNFVRGGAAFTGSASGNIVNISGGSVSSTVYGGYSEMNGSADNNKIIISGSANIENADLYGSNYSSDYGNTGNTLTINGWKGNTGNGDYTVKSLNNFDSVNFDNLINLAQTTNFTVGSVYNVDAVNINSIGAGDYRSGTSKNIKLTLDNNKLDPNKITIIGDYAPNKYYTSERVNADGLFVNKYSQISVEKNATNANTINISATVDKSALTGTFIDADGTVYKNTNRTPYNTNDDTTSLTIGNGFTAETDVVAGAYAAGSQTATGGIINISGTTTWEGTVYAGYSESGSVTNNIINVAAGTKQDISLNGGNQNASSNTLNIEGNGSTFNSIANFETINFNNVALNNDTALSLISANLNGTTLNVKSLAGGNNFKAGDTVTLIESESAIKGTADGITLANEIITAGVAQDLTVSAGQSGDNKIDLTITDVNLNSQTNLAAQTRAASAAFVNQGTDLISDSLDTISRDDNYGVKTFAAVHGNRSKYDVADDIKINGWSTIVGVGNADKFDNGSELSWGVFYENGSGNYRTYNSFNNEFFRGDGSIVYNGGGIAARYENKNGVYTEGSIRAGMLKNELDNAMHDVNGSYGYETESAYYGAHIGVGKIISLSDSSDLDIYGKFFHTYTEGDSVTIADDKFDFDSITSDRLRVGARITSNKENKFSTYYGLAYEYEFNGDADMTAQGLRADTQSLQGSSVMAEVGFNYQPTPDSPWSFDLNMRGYTGERQGGSFNVQATYTF